MTELPDAKRTFYQATLVPRSKPVPGTAQKGRGIEKAAFLASLDPSATEVATIAKASANAASNSPATALPSALHAAAASLVKDRTRANPSGVLTVAQALSTIDTDALLRWGAELAKLRRDKAGTKGGGTKTDSPGADATQALLDSFRRQIEAARVGYLHLERLNFVPAGIIRGELVHSVPLAPGEEVNLSHRQWSNTAEEFERIVTDYEESFSERGVTEKSELVQSTNSQHQHSMGLNTGVTVSGSYGPVSVSANAALTLSDSASETAQSSRNNSINVTRKASARSKKENKFSFRTTSASGTEDQAVQRILNPFPDRAARLDYYQLIRRWRVNLFRYGIRLTYDVTIPEPGLEILSRIREVEDLETVLNQGFNDAEATVSWAQFRLTPSEITAETIDQLAALYGATVPAPPPALMPFEKADVKNWNHEQGDASEFHTLELDVPEGYVVDAATVQRPPTQGQARADGEAHTFYVYPPDFVGRGGHVTLLWRSWHLSSAFVKLTGNFRLTPEAFHEWQLKAWSALHDAALARYYERRQGLQDRLTKLKESLSGEDALSLRKIEREEIMKGVLRWMFGPAFAAVLSALPSLEFGPDRLIAQPEERARTLALGEVIQFLHHAIEWENVLYMLYPYFWSDPNRWSEKTFLEHPDATHRAFLKAGSARVVLTVRPGFERALLQFLDDASFGPPAADSPYLSIAEELEAYASTHYPGIPSDDPEEADRQEQGELIGTWFEHTPTSALDIAFGDTLPTA